MRTRRRGATISSGDPRGMHRGRRDDENARGREMERKRKGRLGE